MGTSITAGPWVANVTLDSAVIAFETNRAVIARVTAAGKTFTDDAKITRHEIRLADLPAAQIIRYTVQAGQHTESYTFNTAPGGAQPSKVRIGSCRGGCICRPGSR